MHLLRARPVTRTVRLELPDGSHRLVKVTTSDARDSQQIECGDHLHAHVIPAPVALTIHTATPRSSPKQRPLLLRNLGPPRARQRFDLDRSTGLWNPAAIQLAETKSLLAETSRS
jgi:hypothetical protein